LTWYGEQLLANTEPLVVTPETAIPVLPQQLSPPYWQAIKNKYAPLWLRINWSIKSPNS
jgi:apolipoprotein N-acyltransferase